jgi:acetyl esterase/lipase
VSSYFRLVDDLQIPPSNIIVAGDSAGGALCLALMMYLRDNDYPLPGAAILLSPWVGQSQFLSHFDTTRPLSFLSDLTMSCESWDSNSKYDVLSKPIQGGLLDPITCYLGEHMEKYLTHPFASPLFGDFTGLPPMLIQAGDAEVLRDEITLLAYKASLAGVKVRHELYEDAVSLRSYFQPMSNLSQYSLCFCFALLYPTGPRVSHLSISGRRSQGFLVMS